ncbi:MAG: tetratricopeptide repeat protein [Rhizobiales bacterium]|nr:tetratricopeptide repeat protein [Hyphomicrobiales bacterium]
MREGPGVTEQHAGKACLLGRLWEKIREHASNAVVGGGILVLTGFTPEHWVAEILHKLRLTDVRSFWPSFIDGRLFVLTVGVAIIVGDLLWRKHRPAAPVTAGVRGNAATPVVVSIEPRAPEPLALPDRPSIAVLPFENMCGEAEQNYFADGIVEEIITSLSRIRWLFVIARNSSFTYKGRVIDIKQVGRELGVRYVLEGSIRKASGRVRIAAQLIDAASGTHLWADRVDGGIEDIFDLQDKVSASVVGAIAPRLQQAEIDRAKRKPTENLDAYDYYLRGMACELAKREDNDQARRLFYKAIELDPEFAAAYGMAAACYVQRKANGWMSDRAQEIAEVTRLARRASELGGNDSQALSEAGYALAFVAGDLDASRAMIDRALALNPNVAASWFFSGFVNVYLGEPEVAIDHLARAMRLSPLDPRMYLMLAATAYAHFLAGRYAEALPWVEKALRENPHHSLTNRIAAATYALAGLQAEAEQAAARLLQIDSSFRVARLKDYVPLRRPEHVETLSNGLRKAGVPE